MPGRFNVAVANGVMVLPSTINTSGVRVGWLGSQVAIRTIVAEGRGVGVSVLVGVSSGVNVKAGVAVGVGALVVEQAMNSSAMTATVNFFCIECFIPL